MGTPHRFCVVYFSLVLLFSVRVLLSLRSVSVGECRQRVVADTATIIVTIIATIIVTAADTYFM